MSQEIQEQLKALTEQNKNLKVRTFDLQEALQGERQSFGQFCNVLAQLLSLSEEEAQDLQNYVNKLAEITGATEAASETAPDQTED